MEGRSYEITVFDCKCSDYASFHWHARLSGLNGDGATLRDAVLAMLEKFDTSPTGPLLGGGR